MVSTYSQYFTFLLLALPLRCKKLITLICFHLLIHSLNRGSTMFPSTVLPQPIDEPMPSYQTITTHSCTSSGSALTCASANEELKWPEASWSEPSCTGKYGKVTMSQSASTSYTKPVGITALMSSMPPQPSKRRKNTILRPTRTKATYSRNMSKSKGWTLQSSLLMLWMEKTRVNNQTKLMTM